MSNAAERFALEAERLAGTPFRLHGRTRVQGVDCIGLVACALEAADLPADPPQGYTLRNTLPGAHADKAGRSGFIVADGPVMRGDLLLVRPGPAQHHLIVALGKTRVVHAHAGLRRVVVQTRLPDWPVLTHWRLSQS